MTSYECFPSPFFIDIIVIFHLPIAQQRLFHIPFNTHKKYDSKHNFDLILQLFPGLIVFSFPQIQLKIKKQSTFRRIFINIA